MKEYLIVLSLGDFDDIVCRDLDGIKDRVFYILWTRKSGVFEIYDLDNIRKPNKKDLKELIKLLKRQCNLNE